jgi:isoleucyl-tRNA synthetase
MSHVFEKVPTELNFPKEEKDVLRFWREKGIFQKTLDAGKDRPSFVFYEGPPTANGTPHNGHVLTRVVKDLFPRYKTMRGYGVPRKAGWDTHGLPVEVEVEKELRIHGKSEIEAYGVEPFAKKCIESVFRYTDEWEKLTERLGFWIDLPTAYVTYHKDYVESVWWALSELFKKDLLYKGHKVVWWWAQGGTALSAGEVGQGYKTVDDPSVYVAFPLKDADGKATDVSLLVWTTTPWTLSSNMYAAVNPKYTYVQVTGNGKKLVVAKELVPALAKKLGELTIDREFPASDLVDRRYVPPFSLYELEHDHRVIAADFVTLDAGTGIVHIAPAFGEDDFTAHKKVTLGDPTATLLCAVKPDGTFIPEMGKYAGRWVKDCDKELSQELKERGLLVFAEQYRHEYPFCWRSDQDPLIQYARPAWYIRTTAKKDDAIANNRAVRWSPEHIKEGRFGDFLANNVDWALSRERFWGTPLNVWVCDKDETHLAAPASCAEIEKKNPNAFSYFAECKKKDPSLSQHLMVHKPWIDQVTFPCEQCGGTMHRVPEVIDCWFDSGCMPFAQWGYPHKGHEDFNRSFPADFISEAIDQTRGWFYSLLMISTLVFDEECQKRLGMPTTVSYPHPYKSCIVLGHVGDKEGKKESKSKGNYTPPDVIIDEVKMDFAVTDAESSGLRASGSPTGEKGAPKAGTVTICREDMEGLDLQEGAQVRVRRADSEEWSERSMTYTVAVGKGMRRRVVVLAPEDVQKLGVRLTEVRDVKPVEVPRLPADERLTISDPTSPAPGSDAFRWFFYASNPPWSNTRHSLSNVRALQKETLIKLRNVYSFFTIYGSIDAFDPKAPRIAEKDRPELDRYILSELEKVVLGVQTDMDAYDVYTATLKITDFVDALSNWYVRRSRERFWRGAKLGEDQDKRAAFETLYECLLTTSKVMAPFTPFAAESMYRNLTGPLGGTVPESVHLTSFPAPRRELIDDALGKKMRAVRDLVSLGLGVRTHAKIKVRQPLGVAHIILSDVTLKASLTESLPMIKEELNVLDVSFVPESETDKYVSFTVKPNFRTLGQKGKGREAQALKKSMTGLSADVARTIVTSVWEKGEATWDGVLLAREDVEISFETKEGFAAQGDKVGVVVLDTRLDESLLALGYARELQNRLQTMRKEMNLDYADRVVVTIEGTARTSEIVAKHGDDIRREVLATSLTVKIASANEHPSADTSSDASDRKNVDVEGESLTISMTRG